MRLTLFSFLKNMFANRCMKPGCNKKATGHPHGIPCCDKHCHEVDCGVWVGLDCGCGKEV